MSRVDKYERRANIVNAISNIIIALMILILVSTIVLGLIFYEDPMTSITMVSTQRMAVDGHMTAL